MKNELITKSVSIIDNCDPDDLFISPQSSADDKFFTATATHEGDSTTLLCSGAHNMCTLTVNNDKINLEYDEFKPMKDLMMRKKANN